MLEFVFRILDGVDLATGWWGIIWRYLGVKWLAAMLLKRRRMVKVAGLTFFQDRTTLEKERSWAELIAQAQEIDAFAVIAHKMLHSRQHLEKIKRLMLPNPDSESIAFYKKQMDQQHVPDDIRTATKDAIDRGIKVKWCPEFVGYSMLLINKEADDARVHIEFALPGMKGSDRPSVTIWKRRFPETYTNFRRAFDNLWEASETKNQ